MDKYGENPETYPPGFEPPTDVKVPWYAWVLWPFAVIAAAIVGALLFRACSAWM